VELATESLLGRAPKALSVNAWSAFLQRVLVSADRAPSDPLTASLDGEDGLPQHAARSEAPVGLADAE